MRTFFISSTFRDMQKERDEMYRQLVPMLSKEAFENGDTIAIRDLRWGVNTSDEKSEEEANQKVLSVCLDEIDECRPYMIILLGYRYGFCPGKELIARAVEERNALAGTEARADRFALKDENISITEMEIRYGAFWKRSGSASPRILVYIRDIVSGEGLEIPKVFLRENEEYWARQQKLIEEVEALSKTHPDEILFKKYQMQWARDEQTGEAALCGAGEFIKDRVIPDVRALLEQEWSAARKLTPFEKELQKHREYAVTKRKKYFVREEIVRDVCGRLGFDPEPKGTAANLLVLRGESGCGKTALMSYLSERFEKAGDNTRVFCLLLFCGYTSSVCRAQDIEKAIVEYLEKILTEILAEVPCSALQDSVLKEENHEALHTRMDELIAHFLEYNKDARGERRRLLIMLDAVDQLDADEMRDHLTFLPGSLSENVQVILSCTPQFLLPFGDGENVLDVKPLSGAPVILEGEKEEKERTAKSESPGEMGKSEKTEILRSMFQSHGKQPYPEVLKAIEEKPGSNNPLYLSLIVQRLVMMEERDFANIDKAGNYNPASIEYQIRIVREECPDDTFGMCASILNYATEKVSQNDPHRAALFQRVIQYIAVSRFGLRDTDLEQIINSEAEGLKQQRNPEADTEGLEQQKNPGADTEDLKQQSNPEADTEGLEQQSNSGTDTEGSLAAGAPSEIWNTLDFTRFFWYMRQLFIIREDGRYDFSHAGIRESYKNGCLRDQREERTDRKHTGNQQQECADGISSAQQTENTDELSGKPEKKLHIQILNHLKNRLEETDPIRINEFVYHCRHADDKAAFVEYICGYKNAKTSNIYTVAAKEVRRMCVEDARNNSVHRIWLYQVLELCNPWLSLPAKTLSREHPFLFGADETEGILSFLCECLEPAFGESEEELKIRKCLWERGRQLAKELYDKKRDAKSLDLVVCACSQLGEVCQLQGGLWNYNMALRLYTEAQEWGEKDENLSRRRDNLMHLGDIYAAMAGRENRNRALGLYRNALELEKQIQEKQLQEKQIQEKQIREKQIREKQIQEKHLADRAEHEKNIPLWSGSEVELQLLRKIGDLLMSGSWECQKQGISLLKSILEETSAAGVCQISDLLRYGDAALMLYGPQEKTALHAFRKAEELAAQKHKKMPDAGNLYRWVLTRERVLFAETFPHCASADIPPEGRGCPRPAIGDWGHNPARDIPPEGRGCPRPAIGDWGVSHAKRGKPTPHNRRLGAKPGEGHDPARADYEKYKNLLTGYQKIYSELDFLEKLEAHESSIRHKKGETSLRIMKTRAVCMEHEGYLLLCFAKTLEALSCSSSTETVASEIAVPAGAVLGAALPVTAAPEDIVLEATVSEDVSETALEIARKRLLAAKEILENDRWDREAIDVRRDRMVLYSNLGDLSVLEEKNGKIRTETSLFYYKEADTLAGQLKKELDTPSACADAITVRLRMGELMISCRTAAGQRSCYLDCLEEALSLAFETGAPSDMRTVSDIYQRLAALEQTEKTKKGYFRWADRMREKAEQIARGTGHPWYGNRNRSLYSRWQQHEI